MIYVNNNNMTYTLGWTYNPWTITLPTYIGEDWERGWVLKYSDNSE